MEEMMLRDQLTLWREIFYIRRHAKKIKDMDGGAQSGLTLTPRTVAHAPLSMGFPRQEY